jgi:hypothetical protein
MATQSTLRKPWKPLLHPQQTQILCPKNLCPTLDFIDDFASFSSAFDPTAPRRVDIAMAVDA